MRPAIFLDRDDTLIACNELPPPPPPGAKGDLVDPALVRLLPEVAEGLILLKAAGFTLVVVSNQGSIARGAATIETVQAVNDRLQHLLAEACHTLDPHVATPILDAIYFCPFHPKGNIPAYTRDHPWRKPNPGMILAAAADRSLDLSRSWLIGDAERDIESAINAGLPAEQALRVGHPPFPSFLAAARHILAASPAPGVSTLRLRALEGIPMDDPVVRDTVIATAHAIAERTGVVLRSLSTDSNSITVTLETHKLAAIGFLAELRRLTNAWYDKKFKDGPLWGTPPHQSEDFLDGFE